jgi:hypothetical protein
VAQGEAGQGLFPDVDGQHLPKELRALGESPQGSAP